MDVLRVFRYEENIIDFKHRFINNANLCKYLYTYVKRDLVIRERCDDVKLSSLYIYLVLHHPAITRAAAH